MTILTIKNDKARIDLWNRFQELKHSVRVMSAIVQNKMELTESDLKEFELMCTTHNAKVIQLHTDVQNEFRK